MDIEGQGFHVIEIQKYHKICNLPQPFTTSFFNLLKDIVQGKYRKLTIVKGLDEFLKVSDDGVIEDARKIFYKAIKDMMIIGVSIVFVVESDINNIPINPMVENKKLSLIIPKQPDMGSIEPGYLYYPIV